MMHRSVLLPVLLALGAAAICGQEEGKVVRLDPALDRLVPRSAKVEKLAGGFGFIEGPLWVHGYLLFSDIPKMVIWRWMPDGQVTPYRKPSGFNGPGVPPSSQSAGSNGLTLDRQGRLIVCEHGNRRLVRLEKDGHVTVLASHYQGKRLNSPNDVVCRKDGSLYFTDPPYGLPREDKSPFKELPFNGIYRLSGGTPQLLDKDLTRPNGLAFSPDEKILYVANSDSKRKIWMRFEVKTDGTLANGRVFFDVTSEDAVGAPDGMKVDRRGNLYGTGPGGIWIFSPQGKHLGSIQLPEIPANCNWGDADGKTLYITARTGLYRIRLSVEGVRP
jgi:gluconolactonase